MTPPFVCPNNHARLKTAQAKWMRGDYWQCLDCGTAVPESAIIPSWSTSTLGETDAARRPQANRQASDFGGVQ